MAIQGSGGISITDIVDEFGGSVPHSLSEYYRNGGEVPGNNTNVPTSGTISMSNFYNAVNEIQITLSSSTTNYQLSSAFGSNWSTAVPKRLTINSGVTIGSSTTTPAMSIEGSMGGTLIVHNTGSILGKGGAGSSSGSGGAGYAAVKSDQNGNITFYNNSGGSIYGGGGGGGRGGNGGTGGQGGSGGSGGSGSYATGHTSVTLHMREAPYYYNHQYSVSGNTMHYAIGRYAQQSYVFPHNYICQGVKGGHYYATTGTQGFQSRGVKGKYRVQFNQGCAYNATQGGAGGGSGGSGGGGGAGGAGGNGRGYNQSQSNGSGGSGGSAGSGGSGGGNNGNGSGTGGTGGQGGTGGTGGTGGNGGGYGASGGSGATGNTGATGNSGGSGSNGNAGNGSGGYGGSSGSGGSGGSSGGAAGYYIQNRHYMTFHNSGSIAGQ